MSAFCTLSLSLSHKFLTRGSFSLRSRFKSAEQVSLNELKYELQIRSMIILDINLIFQSFSCEQIPHQLRLEPLPEKNSTAIIVLDCQESNITTGLRQAERVNLQFNEDGANSWLAVQSLANRLNATTLVRIYPDMKQRQFRIFLILTSFI